MNLVSGVMGITLTQDTATYVKATGGTARFSPVWPDKQLLSV